MSITAKDIVEAIAQSKALNSALDKKILWVHVSLNGEEMVSTSGFLIGANPVEGEMELGESKDAMTAQEMLQDAEEDPSSWDCVIIETGDYNPTVKVQTNMESPFVKVGIFPSPKNDPKHKAIHQIIQDAENSMDDEFFDVVIENAPKNDFSFGAGF